MVHLHIETNCTAVRYLLNQALSFAILLKGTAMYLLLS
jgi:hypothetical protein